MERDFDNDFTEEFSEGASRAFWADSWASGEEERGESLGQVDILDAAPETPLSAWVAAGELKGLLEAVNGVPIHTLADRAGKADGQGGIEDVDAKEFGHYMAMQALGHGVSWFDDHASFKIDIPNMEYHAGGQFAENPRDSRQARAGKVHGQVGDVDPILHAGGLVYEGADGPILVYTEGLDDEQDEDDPNVELQVYEVAIEDDVTKDLDWVKWSELAGYVGETTKELKKRARAKSPMTRAQVYLDVASYHGWQNLDSYPLKKSVEQLNGEWFPGGNLASKM